MEANARKFGDKAMTREEEIRNAIDTTFPIPPSEKGRTYEQALMATGFENGIKWSDTHPKSQWISVEEDLPCNHEELIKNENYTKNVLVVLSWNDNPSKKHIEICDMCNVIGSFNTNWYWRNAAYYNVVCWKPLPELPKE